MVMTRSVGVCLAPTDENSYKQILEFRRSIYQNPDLIALGIEQQYHFTAHITLAYFGDTGPNLRPRSLVRFAVGVKRAMAGHAARTVRTPSGTAEV